MEKDSSTLNWILLEYFCNNQIEYTLEKRVQNNLDYVQLCKEEDEFLDHFQQLNKNDLIILDKLVSVLNAKGGLYGNEAYYQGFEDGIWLSLEIIRDNRGKIDTKERIALCELIVNLLHTKHNT